LLERATESVDELDFALAEEHHTTRAYQYYTTLHPGGTRSQDAQWAIEDIHAEAALRSGTEQAYLDFLASEAGQTYHDRNRVFSELQDVAYEETIVTGTEEALVLYSTSYPTSPHLQDVERRLFTLVTAGAKPQAYVNYLDRYGTRSTEHCRKFINKAYLALYLRVDASDHRAISDYLSSFPASTLRDRAERELYGVFASEPTERSLAKYVALYPGHAHAMEAWSQILAFYDMSNAISLGKFLARYPDAPLSSGVREEMYRLDFVAACDANTEEAYTRFIDRHPNSPQAALARDARDQFEEGRLAREEMERALELERSRDECESHLAWYDPASDSCECGGGFRRSGRKEDWVCEPTAERAAIESCIAQCVGVGEICWSDCADKHFKDKPAWEGCRDGCQSSFDACKRECEG